MRVAGVPGALRLGNSFGSRQHGFSLGPHAHVLREVDPAHGAGGVDQKLSRTGNVGSIRSPAHMEQIITTNDLSLGIGEEGKCVTGFPAQLAGDFRRVNTNGDRANARVVEFPEVFLYAS
jgi:hypothetical protein